MKRYNRTRQHCNVRALREKMHDKRQREGHQIDFRHIELAHCEMRRRRTHVSKSLWAAATKAVWTDRQGRSCGEGPKQCVCPSQRPNDHGKELQHSDRSPGSGRASLVGDPRPNRIFDPVIPGYQWLESEMFKRSPFHRAETSVLFELISAGNERRSMLITANQPFGEWGEGLSRSRHDARGRRSPGPSRQHLRDECRELPPARGYRSKARSGAAGRIRHTCQYRWPRLCATSGRRSRDALRRCALATSL